MSLTCTSIDNSSCNLNCNSNGTNTTNECDDMTVYAEYGAPALTYDCAAQGCDGMTVQCGPTLAIQCVMEYNASYPFLYDCNMGNLYQCVEDITS